MCIHHEYDDDADDDDGGSDDGYVERKYRIQTGNTYIQMVV